MADVVFYKIEKDGTHNVPVLYLDTLKVSTIEQTADSTDARGGKGNAALISWDFGKEITVNLEDALFSMKSMAIMYGQDPSTLATATDKIRKTISFVATANSSDGAPKTFDGPQGKSYAIGTSVTYYDATGSVVPAASLSKGVTYFATFEVTPTEKTEIKITADDFPGTYYIVGDTYSRAESNGVDSFFQFVIPKGKVLSENTITLEAEGDPSVFTMQVKVLRPADGVMMKLVKYDLSAS